MRTSLFSYESIPGTYIAINGQQRLFLNTAGGHNFDIMPVPGIAILQFGLYVLPLTEARTSFHNLKELAARKSSFLFGGRSKKGDGEHAHERSSLEISSDVDNADCGGD